MTKEIKERIEKIRKGEVPEGYRKTKIGIVPKDWKEEKIGDLFYKVTERNNGQFDNTKWISVAKMYYQEPEKVTSNNIDTRTYVMRTGDMAFEGHPNKEFLFGRFVVNDLGDGIISELFPIYRYRKEYILNYWKYAIQFERIMARIYIRCITMSGASSNKINDTEFVKESLYIPPLPEQKKIAEILSTQDKLIGLLEKKIDELKSLKKAYLQKMFPKNGEVYPEIRFKGFTDAWEQRKLGELAEFNPKSELPDVFEYVDLESVIGTQMISHRTESKSSAPSRAQRLAQKGDLFYQTVRPYQKNNHLYEKDDNNYVFSTGYAQLRPYNDGYFLLALVQNEGFVKVVLDNCTGTSYPAINSSDLANIEVDYPKSKEEQQKIGAYFKYLDTLITLHQRELEQEKQKKKALMQLLLNGIVRVKI